MRRTGRVPTVRGVTGPPRDGTTAGGQPRGSFRAPAARVPDTLDLYAGNANPELARKIGLYLDVTPGRVEVFEFANENIFVKIWTTSGSTTCTSSSPPARRSRSRRGAADRVDAFKRASAGRITAVVPYYAYGRSDKKDQPRVPITARLIADMIGVAVPTGCSRWTSTRARCRAFNIPVDELTAVHLLNSHFIPAAG